jgi:BlaI family transcriptional regulator, penicillinase repressor
MLDQLPRRERQLLDTLFALKRGTAEEIRAAMSDAPSNSAVRAMLARLESKGFVSRRPEGQRYVYSPSVVARKAGETALRQVVRTYFDDSAARAATALLGMTGRLDEAELTRLEEMIRHARKENP